MERKEPSWLSPWFQFIHLFNEYEIFYLETMDRFPLASDACLCFMKTAAAVKPFWPSWQCLSSSSSSPLGLSWNKTWREKRTSDDIVMTKTNVVCLVSICSWEILSGSTLLHWIVYYLQKINVGKGEQYIATYFSYGASHRFPCNSKKVPNHSWE